MNRSAREPLPLLLFRRWLCHRSLWCCQYIDTPQCRSPHDPHRLARRRHLRNTRRHP